MIIFKFQKGPSDSLWGGGDGAGTNADVALNTGGIEREIEKQKVDWKDVVASHPGCMV